MNCNYKVNIKDIQNKYKFNIFAMGGYNDSDLRKMIESVYYALPRTTGTGTSVTLNDTAFSYMKNKLYATETSQDTTTGANLVNIATSTFVSWSYSNGKITSSPITTSSGGVNTFIGLSSNPFEVNANETVFIKFKARKVSGTGDFSGNINDSDNGYTTVSRPALNSNYQDYVMKHTYNSSYNFTKVLIQFPNGACNNLVVEIKDFMVSKSDIDYEEYTGKIPSPNPDYPQLIHTINGDNTIKVCGKNLLNFSLPFNITGETNKFLNYVPKLEIGQNYYFVGKTSDGTKILGYQCVCVWYNTNTSSSIKTQVVNETFAGFDTSGANNFYVYFGGSLAGKTVSEFMLVKGTYDSSNIPDYEPYQSNSVLLTLGDKEICKIGNYEDKIFKAIKGNEIYDSLASEEKTTLDYGKWYLRKNTTKLIFNGSEYWTTRTSGSVTLYELGVQGRNLYSTLLERIGLSNQYVETPYLTEDNTFRIQNGSVLAIHNDTIGSVANLKNALGTNNLIVYYPLATPVNELFNDTNQDQLEDIYNNMLSYEGQTNVSQVNDDLPFNINSTAIKDLNDL